VSHCGAPSTPCDTVCIDGVCVAPPEVAAGLGAPGALTVDEGFVYFANTADDSIMRVVKTGGAATPLATGQPGARHLAIDATDVYFTDTLGGAVMRVGKSGGMPELVTAAVQPGAIAVDADAVYWVNGGTIMRIDKTAGAVATPLGTGSPPELAVDDTYLYWSATAIYRVTKSGGTPTQVAVPPDPTADFALGPQHLAWLAFPRQGGYQFRLADKNGGCPRDLEFESPLMGAFVIDDGHVYASPSTFNPVGSLFPGVFRYPTLGGTRARLAGVAVAPATAMAQDMSYLYFSVASAGAIYRIPK